MFRNGQVMGFVELVSIVAVAKGLGATRACGRKRSSQVTCCKAGGEIFASDEFVQEPGIEAVAGSNGIHDSKLQAWTIDSLIAPASHCAVFAYLHDQQWNLL